MCTTGGKQLFVEAEKLQSQNGREGIQGMEEEDAVVNRCVAEGQCCLALKVSGLVPLLSLSRT